MLHKGKERKKNPVRRQESAISAVQCTIKKGILLTATVTYDKIRIQRDDIQLCKRGRSS
jgi:hypothetical protein